MPSPRSALWRDPLVHFLVLGAVLLVAQRWMGGPEVETDGVSVSPAVEQALVGELSAQLGRPPSPEELEERRERWITDEVLYREALRIGLDRGDPIVRRRLIQRMRFVLEDLAGVPALDDEALQARIDAAPDRYQREPLYTLDHVYLSPDRHVDVAGKVAEVKAALEQGIAAETLGDPFPQGRHFEARPAGAFARVFGEDFARQLPSVEEGWVQRGSASGVHLVRVSAVVPGRPLTLAEAREQVRRDSIAEAQRAEVDARVEALVDEWTEGAR